MGKRALLLAAIVGAPLVVIGVAAPPRLLGLEATVAAYSATRAEEGAVNDFA